MKIAVFSDIHGNLEALEAATEDVAGMAADMVVCLGDLIGYGPDPEAVVSRVARLGFVSVLGNHEEALVSRRARQWMNFQARENSVATELLLSADCRRYCSGLPRLYRAENALFVHGAPPDSVTTYLYNLKKPDVEKIFAENSERIFFVGHTHELQVISLEDKDLIREKPVVGKRVNLRQDKKYLVNCGSVGQPRDGDSRAKYILWDSDRWTVDVRAVRYDIETTAEKILARGFPRAYADRLR